MAALTHTPERQALFRKTLQSAFAKLDTVLPRLIESHRTGSWAAMQGDVDYFKFEEDFFDIGNWTPSFFTGMALLDIERGGPRTHRLEQLAALEARYQQKITVHSMDTMHDMGFLYSLYAVGMHRVTGEASYRTMAIRAADELSKRFDLQGGYIRAWGRMDDHRGEYAGLAIIDCMMNLPLLFWASQETGNPFYRQIAVSHADRTLANFVRPDNTLSHAFRFDVKTGQPIGPDNYCGYSVDSTWARGNAWAIYGFALAHRYTGEARYLEVSRRIAHRFVELMGDTKVPVWDFNLPAHMPLLLDTSAAAIAACGAQELQLHFPEDDRLERLAGDGVEALCAQHINHDPACMGLLRDAEVGAGRICESPVLYGARSVYTSFGDYFLTEALTRHLHGLKSYW